MKDLIVVTDYPSMDMNNTWQYHIFNNGSVYVAMFGHWIEEPKDLQKLDSYAALIKAGHIVKLKGKNTFVPRFIKELKISTWKSEKQLRKEYDIPQICDGRSISLDIYKGKRKRGYYMHGSVGMDDFLGQVNSFFSFLHYLHSLRLAKPAFDATSQIKIEQYT